MNNETVKDKSANRLWVLLLITAGVLFITLCFYPGYLSFDSVEQLKQARSGTFTDWHPPLMSWVWRQLDRVIAGSAGMLFFHNLLFWSGLALLVSRAIKRKLPAILLVFVIGFFPPVIALLGTIWKDVGLAASLLLACGLLCCAQQTGRKAYWVGAIFALFYGLSVRHNGVFAVFPLAIWASAVAAGQWRRRPGKPWVATLAIGLIILVSLMVFTWAVNSVLIQGRKTYVFQAILLHDLAAVSVAAGQMYVPPYVNQGTSIDELRTIYTPNEVVPLFCCNAAPHHLHFTTDSNEIAQLEKTWLYVITHHPQSYLAHRTAVFKVQFGIGQNQVCLPFESGIYPNSLGISMRPSWLNSVVMWRLEQMKNSLLFRGWFFLLLLIALLLVAMLPNFRQHAMAVYALGSSGLLYGLSYFFIAPTCDFRMYWWMVVVTCMLPTLIFATQINNFAERSASALASIVRGLKRTQ